MFGLFLKIFDRFDEFFESPSKVQEAATNTARNIFAICFDVSNGGGKQETSSYMHENDEGCIDFLKWN